MEDQLQLLWQVQQLEQECKLWEKRKNHITLQEANALWEEVNKMTQSIVVKKGNLQQLQAVCEKQEVVLTDTTSKSQELEKLLYSGDIKNLKEIEHLKAQYDASQQEVSELERDYFAEVDESDALTKEIAISETALQNKKIEHVKKQQSISAEIAEAAAKIENLQRKCQELLTVIEPQFVEKYITLKRKIHSPIAKMRNGICGGCRMGLPESLVASNDNRLTYCDHCGRILIASSD